MKLDEQKLIKVKAPFVDEISGMATIKIIDGGTYSTLLIKLKFTHNKVILDVTNTGKDTMILRPEEMIGIVDIRSLGYYKIKQGILQQIQASIIDLRKQRSSVNTVTNLWIL